ncbi:MAG: PsbP-related protein [Dictyoglomus turgidum]|uniref:PsbP-related protein n=1 Tax=Dictyoglomus turgidum TaxID=513050 RepID=UPI003C73FBEC
MSKLLKLLLFISLILCFSFNILLADTNKYVDEKLGFSIVPPEGWEVKDGKPYNLAVMFVGPADEGFMPNFNINVVNLPGEVTEINEDLISAIKVQLEAVGEYYGSLEFISEGVRDVSKYKGYEIVYTLNVDESLSLEQKQVYIIYEGRFYIFTFTSLKDNFEKYLPAFEKSLSTFEIL